MMKIKIALTDKPYNVFMSKNDLDKINSISEKLKLNKNLLIICDKNVHNYWKKEVNVLLRSSKKEGKANLLIINSSERLKSFNTSTARFS